MPVEHGDELRDLAVAADSSEFLLGFENAGGGPASSHVAFVSPAFHVAGGGAHDVEHRFDHVGAYQRSGQCAVDAETPNGEHVIEALAETAGRVGTRLVKLGSEASRLQHAGVRVRIRERSPQPCIDSVAVLLGEMTGDVSALVEFMRISA